MDLFGILVGLAITGIVIISALKIYFHHKFQYWKKLGIYSVEPSFPFGNCKGLYRKKSLVQLASDHCLQNTNQKIIGVYLFSMPRLLINDPRIAKDMLVRDFSSFHDRGFEINTEGEPLAEFLFALNGKEWRNLRVKLTPTFTSGKMKMMFPTLIEIGQVLKSTIEKHVNEPEVEMKDMLSRYTMDVISSCAFGLESSCLENSESEFRKVGLIAITPTPKLILINLLMFVFPDISKRIKLSILPKYVSRFFIGLVRDTMDYREKNNVKRNDFLQLLLQLKNLGYVENVDNENKSIDKDQRFTVEKAAAQAFSFFFAGFETSSSAMQFSLYELALNTRIQRKLQAEIDSVLANHDGELTYESVHEMKYLNMVVSETLRKYPISPILMRKCNKEYKIAGTDHVLEAGTNVLFPLYAYHHNPNNYPSPEVFDPDRFTPDNISKRDPYTYLPFGEGPRSCIGNRFALMQIKAGLAIIFSKFNVDVSKRTPIPIVFDPKNDILNSRDHMHLKMSLRK